MYVIGFCIFIFLFYIQIRIYFIKELIEYHCEKIERYQLYQNDILETLDIQIADLRDDLREEE